MVPWASLASTQPAGSTMLCQDQAARRPGFPGWHSASPPQAPAPLGAVSIHRTIVLGTMAPVMGDCLGRHAALLSRVWNSAHGLRILSQNQVLFHTPALTIPPHGPLAPLDRSRAHQSRESYPKHRPHYFTQTADCPDVLHKLLGQFSRSQPPRKLSSESRLGKAGPHLARS